MIKKPFDKTKYKAIAFDLDGTLLDFGEMSQITKQAIELLNNQGITIIISTGRGIPIIPNEILKLASVRYIVSSSGACVTDLSNKKVLLNQPIPKQTAIDVLRCIKPYHAVASVFYPKIAVYTISCLRAMKKRVNKNKKKKTHFKPSIKLTWNLIKTIKKQLAPIEKLNCYFNSKEQCANAIAQLKQYQSVEAITTLGDDIEINASGVNKASGLKSLCNHLGIDIREVVAFGDSQNDASMFRSCGYSVVMGNAENKIKSMADYIAFDAAHDGAARAACDLFEINLKGM